MIIIPLYANQKTIRINSSSGRKDKVETPFGVITRRELKVALHVLDDGRNSTPIELFFYLATNQDGYEFDYSPAALQKQYGISRDRWRSAFLKLEEHGYLVPGKEGSCYYTFYSLPERYKKLTFDNEQVDSPERQCTDENVPADEKSLAEDQPSDTSPGATDALTVGHTPTVGEPLAEIASPNASSDGSPADEDTLTDEDTPADEDRVLPPTGIGYPCRQGEGTPTDGDSNNKDMKDIKKNNKELDNQHLYPESEDIILEELHNEFGHLEDCSKGLLILSSRSKSDGIKNSVIPLKKLQERLRTARADRVCAAKNKYQCALDSTKPKNTIQRIALCAILDKYFAEHNGPISRLAKKYGAWLDGWNVEAQEPNIVIALYPLYTPVVMGQSHNIDDVPREYYLRKTP